MLYERLYRTEKFSDNTLGDAWFLRSVFTGNCDSVASYKQWIGGYIDESMDGRKVRGSDIRYKTDYRMVFEI